MEILKKLNSRLVIFLLIILSFPMVVFSQDYTTFLTSTNDYGQNWSTPVPIPYTNIFSTAKLTEVNGIWYLHGSSKSADSVLYITSYDQGQTWDPPKVYKSGLNARKTVTWLDSTGFYILILEENYDSVSVLIPNDFLKEGPKISNISGASYHPMDIIRTSTGSVYIAFLDETNYNVRYMVSFDNCSTWMDQNINNSDYYYPKYSVIDTNFVIASNHYGSASPYDAWIRYTQDDAATWSSNWVNVSNTSGMTLDRYTQIARTNTNEYLAVWFASNDSSIFSSYSNNLDDWSSATIDTLFTNVQTMQDFSLNAFGNELYLIYFNNTDVAPSPPQNPAYLAEDSQITLSWSANTESDIAEYILFRNSIKDTSSWDTLAIVNHPGTSYTDNSVFTGNTYYYWIKTVDNLGLESIATYIGEANLFNKANYTAYFDGIDDFIISKLTTVLESNYSVEFWFKYDEIFSSNTQLFSRANSPYCYYEPSIRLSNETDDEVRAYTSGCGGSGLIGSEIVNSGQWHHIAVCANSDSQWFYVDSNLVAKDNNYIRSISEKFSIGAYAYLRSSYSPFIGYIDELRVWDTTRTQLQIQSFMNDTLPSIYYTTADSNLAAYWRLDGNALDLSVNANHGEVFGGTIFVPSDAPLNILTLDDSLFAYYPFDGNAADESGNGLDGIVNNAVLTYNRFGEADKAYYFNDSTSYIEIPSTSGFNVLHDGSSYSISLWVKRNPGSFLETNHDIILCNTPGGDRNGIRFSFINQMTEYFIGVNPGVYPVLNGQWHESYSYSTDWKHLVITYDYDLPAEQLKCYFDGQLIGSTDRINNHQNGDANYNMFIGRYVSSTAYFSGCIDDIRFYNRVLTLDEINQLYSPGNRMPVLSWNGDSGYENDGLSPDSATANDTYIFKVKYQDADGDAPEVNFPLLHIMKDNVEIAGSPFPMNETGIESFILGRTYSIEIDSLDVSNNYSYYFEAKDSQGNQATGSASLVQNGPIVTSTNIIEFTQISTGNIVTDKANSRGISWGDYNNDGFEDLYVCNSTYARNFFYQNNGDGSFTKMTNSSIVSNSEYSYNSSWGDYDNDSYLDLVIFNTTHNNELFRNNGDGTFTQITDSPIATSTAWSTGGSWGDYDNDGYLDLIVANADYNYSPNNFLFRNNEDGTFTQITDGDIVNDGGYSFSPSWADYNNDGYIDVYISNNVVGQQSFLYKNNGDGTFSRILEEPFISDTAANSGSSWGDYDNDGDMDLYITVNGGNNLFYENNGDGTFFKNGTISIVEESDSSNASIWTDFNNDGFLDLFFINSYKDNCLYFNNGNKTFTRSYTGNIISNNIILASCAAADYDNDGFADIFISTNYTDPNKLFHNDGNNNNWIEIKCIGAASNYSAIGTKVFVKANIDGNSYWQMREISGLTGGIHGSQNNMRAMFGLGNAAQIDSIKIQWPSNVTQIVTNVAVNQILTVTEEVPERIDNSVVYLHFDHKNGMIDSLVFKQGSNNDLLDQSWNNTNHRGLGRLSSLDNGSSRPTNIHLYSDSASIIYNNPNYGNKIFKMRWSSGSGFEMDMLFDVSTDGSEGAAWEPGGDNDTNDTIKVIRANSSTQTIAYTYPGTHQTLFYDWGYATGTWDGDYDEVYGYAFKTIHQLSISNGASADGPFAQIFSGLDTIHFAVKSSSAYWNWVSGISGYQSIDFIHTLTVIDANNESKELHFGTDPLATDGYDSNFDLYAPPVPPSGAFDARLKHGGEDFIDDIRPTNSSTLTWEISYQPSANGDPVTLNWDNTILPKGKFQLIDVPTGGSMVNIDMKTVNSFSDGMGIYDLKIVYTLSEAFSQQVNWGWNMLGLAYNPDNKYYLNLFPNAVQNTLYGFNSTYFQEDTLEIGVGYWLRFDNAETIPLEGYPINSLTLNLAEGWNMICGISANMPLANINDPNNIIIPGTLFGFDGVYVANDTIVQGEGYWIRANSTGQISLDINSAALPKTSNTLEDLSMFPVINIEDTRNNKQRLYFNVEFSDPSHKLSYSLPPLPPKGSFDVRFAGDYRVTESDEAIIHIQTSAYPIKINLEKLNIENRYGYVLEELSNNKVVESHEVQEGQSIQINNPAVKILKLRKIEVIPQRFIVYQNYPNPFNPTTEIKYGLPEDGVVEIVIYNVLGKKVKTLINKQERAGYHKVTWDATNTSHQKVSTGLYFYRVKAGENYAIKKMLLLK